MNEVPRRRASRPDQAKITTDLIREVRKRLAAGEYQHGIAADLHLNQGRISKINTGKLGAEV
jgi:hypothetical protein